ncbi:MAG: DUF4114 domain-containing protein [Reyranella sp.]
MASPSYHVIEHSTFVDFTGYRVTNATTAQEAYGFDDGVLFSPSSDTPGIAVALVLPRANDPTTLLDGDWGSRQQELAALNAQGALWTTYGTDPAVFHAARTYVTDTLGLTVLDASNSTYVTSAESRTIWVSITSQADFQALFGTDLRYSSDAGIYFWNGNLSKPDGLDLAGLWIDVSTIPPGSNLAPGVSATLPEGPQSLGNNAPAFKAGETVNLVPQDMAAQYNFPLDGAAVQTKAVGLLEPAIGAALPDGDGLDVFRSLLTDYLTAIGQSGDGVLSVQGIEGQNYTDFGIRAGERSLDVSVVAGVNPNSDIVLFNGAGGNGLAWGTTYTAIQSATFPGADKQRVSAWSDSFGDAQSMSPDSLFYKAYWELYVDSVLANQTAVTALGDGGASEEIGNGLTNLEYNCTQPYSLLVGGSSLSLLSAAQRDPTLAATVLAPAMAGDLALIWQLVAGGMSVLPTNLTSDDFFVETAWNYYNVVTTVDKSGNTIHHIEGPPEVSAGYPVNSTTNGGVDPTQPVPSYQVAYGLTPTTTDPLAQVGRGAPDVTANGGGNAFYQLANADMSFTGGYYYGTSAASPLWASLIVQIDTIFADQGLPDLGYAHDLLYTASAIAPAAFNDVTMGNNVGSWAYGDQDSPYMSGGIPVIPTGFGYYAGPGYDLVSGLGSPNGTVLARTLSAIAHSQLFFASNPDMLDADGSGGWTSGADQSLILQTMSAGKATVAVELGGVDLDFTSGASQSYAWTARLAEQTLQADFDPALVQLYDGFRQGAVAESIAAAGVGVSVQLNGTAAEAIQGTLSSPFGFADFMTVSGVVRMARAVAVAETAGGADDQMAVVRVRQNGVDDMSVSFFEVDDLTGVIGNLEPGEAGYAAAALANAYQLASGGTVLHGPGYGNYVQTMLLDVDAGDYVAMMLANQSSGETYWAFSRANPDGHGHLWSYGLNTWGFEDQLDGGDRDFNDLVIGLDFTSAAGQGWLA